MGNVPVTEGGSPGTCTHYNCSPVVDRFLWRQHAIVAGISSGVGMGTVVDECQVVFVI